jgi:hypothetical protein
MPDYFTNVETTGGIGCDHIADTIGVVETLHKPVPIGTAYRIGRTDEGFALWRLQVRGAPVPGRWVVLGKWFVADEG